MSTPTPVRTCVNFDLQPKLGSFKPVHRIITKVSYFANGINLVTLEVCWALNCSKYSDRELFPAGQDRLSFK